MRETGGNSPSGMTTLHGWCPRRAAPIMVPIKYTACGRRAQSNLARDCQQHLQMSTLFSTIDEAIDAIRGGRVVIVADAEDRENEGDFIAAAEKITPEIVNFMITHGRGQLCMPLLPEVSQR